MSTARQEPSTRAAWSRFRLVLGERRGIIAGLALASVLAGLAESAILAIVAQAAAALVAGNSAVGLQVGPLHVHGRVVILLIGAIVLAVVRLGLQVGLSLIPARIAADVQASLRSAVFTAFTRAPWSEQSRDREGHFQELMTTQSAQAVQAPLQATLMLVTLTSFLMLVLSALVLDPLAAVIVLAVAMTLWVLLRPLSNLGSQNARAMSGASLNYAGGVSEAVRLAEETRIFGVSSAQRNRIDRLITAVRNPFFHTQALARFVPGTYQSLIYLLVAAALVVLDLSGTGHIAALGAVVLLLVRAGAYGQQAQGAYQYMRQAIPFLERVELARRRYADSCLSPGVRPLPGIRSVEFEDVSYSYEPERPVLREISFAVLPGETVGIVGPTGAGKSTLVQILLGLRTPESGRYLINGFSAAEYRPRDWQRVISYLPQEPRLIHASAAENIRFFRDIDDQSVSRAAVLAGIHEEILTWSQGYETLIGPRANAVSGGQQQRICLARALATGPELLVLDEPTSALDPRSEALIQDSLRALKDELTLFIVAHRMSTLSICDRVMVIVDGQLQAFDTATALQSNAYFSTASALSHGGL